MKPVPGILDIAPYVGGRAEAAGAARVFKLSSNESPLGPSPKAVEAFKAAAASMHLYPEGSAALLRQAIGEAHDIPPERIAATGLNVRSSVGNFLLIEFPETGAKSAAAADKFLMSKGVILRGVGAYGLSHALRISVGTEEGNRAAVAAIEEFMA